MRLCRDDKGQDIEPCECYINVLRRGILLVEGWSSIITSCNSRHPDYIAEPAKANMGKFTSNLKFLSIAGVGLFGDGFLNISIGLVVPVVGLLYYQDDGGKIPTIQSDAIKGGLSLGMIVGQLLFGVFGDALGRHKIYGKELVITILGTLMLIVPPTYLGHNGIVAWLTTFRIITGLGIGGGEIDHSQ